MLLLATALIAAIPSQEAWVGPLQLCAGTVRSVRATTNSYTQERTVTVVLTGDARRQLAALTERSVGQQIAIRVAGRVISEPYVNEPLRGGEFELNGPMPTLLNELKAAARAPCRAPRR